ncbi:D-tagatose-1,6-bisphosphate aldolase subunit KbaY [Barrientosiimonas humi]|nr:D-tagatose-1,6-bisphosphate aldolase subunit KbaY [Barrientosiimonas humi]
MQISQNAVRYHGALAPIAAATLAVARASEQPVVVHLDHAEDEDLVREAVELGLTSVMYDGSRLPDEQNREATARVVQRCHDAGVSVEAELGEVGGKDGVHAPGVRTDPADAAQFVADTGVDALAVAVGSSHAMTSRTAELDVDLIARLREGVPVPLVLHGSSGVPDAGLVAAVRAGMRKVNIATHLNQVSPRRCRRRCGSTGPSTPAATSAPAATPSPPRPPASNSCSPWNPRPWWSRPADHGGRAALLKLVE